MIQSSYADAFARWLYTKHFIPYTFIYTLHFSTWYSFTDDIYTKQLNTILAAPAQRKSSLYRLNFNTK